MCIARLVDLLVTVRIVLCHVTQIDSRGLVRTVSSLVYGALDRINGRRYVLVLVCSQIEESTWRLAYRADSSWVQQ